jgi:hypothetical protein
MSFQRLTILFVFATLAGCSTAPKPTLPTTSIEPQNKEKDQYIEKVEAVVSDSASALTAVVPVLNKGTVREVVEAQVTRLSGVSKPSVAKVEEFKRIIASDDKKAVEQDKKEASKVDAETTALYAMVEQKDFEISEAHARADAEFKQKILWQYSTAGLGVFIAGLMAMAFTPFKKSAGITMAGGMLAMASAWIFESNWFTWIVAGAIGITTLSVLYSMLKKPSLSLSPVAQPEGQDHHMTNR